MTRSLEKLISHVTSAGMLHAYSWETEKVPDIAEPIHPALASSSSASASSSASDGNDAQLGTKRKSKFSPAVEAGTEVSAKKKSKSDKAGIAAGVDEKLLQMRSDRFKMDASKPPASAGGAQQNKKRVKEWLRDQQLQQSAAIGEFNIENLRIVGTCQTEDMYFFGLPSAPDPSTVRPERVLRKALTSLKKKWRSSAVDYIYMCSQMKAIRQDLTVQHIQNGT
jgi:hypothetical protein